MPKAMASGADAVIFDLEDAVAAPAKEDARDAVAEFLAAEPAGSVLRWVRVNNAPDLLTSDLGMASSAGADGVIIPKAESPTQLEEIVAILADTTGPAARPAVVALIESGAGVMAARRILGINGVLAAAVGEADLSADLGVPFTDDSPALLHARINVVIASAAAAVHPPIGPVTTNFRDLDAFASSCTDLVRVGYQGRQVIHPAQVEPANSAFTPDSEEVGRAEALLVGFDAAEAEGVGVYVDDDGRMVDLAVIRAARRLVARAILANR